MGNASNHVKGGYIGRLLYADLSKAALRTVNLEPPFMLRYVGGRGWGARIIWDEIPPRADPLGPRNKLCVITGPLTGTLAVASGKTSFSAISPATGYYGDSNMGGVFGVRLKQAGFDGLVIEGRATSPVYLWVRDGEAEIRDAGDYWGKGSLEAETIIRRDLGDARASVVSIGPAGENLVKFACITGDYGRQAARCGLGAVMGSKGLKAIAVSGSQDIPVADIGGLWQVFKEVMRFISESVDTDFWRRQGTWQFFEWSNGNECLPTRNFSETICRPFSRMGDVLAGGSKAADTTCFLCPIGCGNLCRVRTGGRAVATIGPEYESAAMLGPNCGIESFTDVAYAAYLCDELGLDAVSAGAVAAFAMECRERGILTDKDLGVDLRFGNGDALFRFLEMLARRDGIGNLFAEGVKGASKVIGRGSERFAMHVKGLEMTAYDHRVAPAMSLAFATCMPAETEIFTAKGSPVKIGEVVNSALNGGSLNLSVLALMDNRMEEHAVVAYQRLPAPAQLVELTTASGVRIRCTADHELLVDRDSGLTWVRSEDLSQADFVVSPRRIESWKREPLRPADLLPINTIVLDESVKARCKSTLLDRFGSIRKGTRALGIPRKPFVKGSNQGLKIEHIWKICEATGLEWGSIRRMIGRVRGLGGARIVVPEKFDEKLGYLLGLIASDGCIRSPNERCSRPHTVFFTNRNPVLRRLFIDTSISIFSAVPIRKSKRSYNLVTCNSVLANIAYSLGIKSPKERMTLDGIFRLSDPVIAAFLRGYFDGDGTCSYRKGRYYHISYTMEHYHIAKRIHQLLKRLGIRSKIFTRKDLFDVYITTPGDKISFIEKIGSSHPSKNKKLHGILNCLKKHRIDTDGYDLMPKICGKIIEKIRKRYRIPRSLLPIHRGALRSAERGRSHLRRASLKKIVSKLRDIVDASDGLLADLERYCKQPFYVEPIRSIKRVQADGGFVYDITVEDAHNFLPEGAIVASNCDIGAHHNRAWAIIDDIEMGREKYDEGKARRVIYLQHLRPLYDCLGVCRFMWIEFHVDPDYYVKAYAAATGVETSLTRLLEKMEMIWNLVRCISVRRGMEGSEDWLPRKVFEEPVPSGRFKGAVLDEARFERLLRTYYKLRGWTRDGVPTQRRLKRLGLIDIADDYEALRKPSSPRDSGKHGAGVAEGNDRVSVQR